MQGWMSSTNIDTLIINVTCWLLSTGTAQMTLSCKCLHWLHGCCCNKACDVSINSSASIQSRYPSLQRDGHDGLTVGTACLHRITHHPCCKCNVLYTLNVQRMWQIQKNNLFINKTLLSYNLVHCSYYHTTSLCHISTNEQHIRDAICLSREPNIDIGKKMKSRCSLTNESTDVQNPQCNGVTIM